VSISILEYSMIRLIPTIL